jgi:predicted enzyme related to lactoylglutathione lyase
MPNPVVHFEIMGVDKAALREFYSGAFGWSIDANNPMEYGLVDTGGEGVNGAVDSDPDVDHTVVIYIEVDDPGAYLEKVKGLGGEVVQDVTVIPEMVTMARFRNPAGNVIGLVKSEGES